MAAEKQTEGAVCCHLTRTSSRGRRKLLKKKHSTGEETWVGGYDKMKKTVLTMDITNFPETQKGYSKVTRTLRSC